MKVLTSCHKSDSKVALPKCQSDSKVTFSTLATFESLWPRPRNSLLSHFFVSLIFLGVSAQWAKRDTLMSRGKNSRETIFVSQLSRSYPHRGGNFERGENALSCGRETVLEAFQETIWARVIASQKSSRDSGESIFAARHQGVSQGPLGGSPRLFPGHNATLTTHTPLIKGMAFTPSTKRVRGQKALQSKGFWTPP